MSPATPYEPCPDCGNDLAAGARRCAVCLWQAGMESLAYPMTAPPDPPRLRLVLEDSIIRDPEHPEFNPLAQGIPEDAAASQASLELELQRAHEQLTQCFDEYRELTATLDAVREH